MQVRHFAQTLTTSTLLALVGVGALAGSAFAQPPQHPVDNGVRCARHNHATGEWEFYLPGETTYTINGTRLTCGGDGNWIPDNTVAQPPSNAGAAPLPSGGALAEH
jgi:hypothetical protein